MTSESTLRRFLLCCLLTVAALPVRPVDLSAQTRSMAQDSTLDNLRHPEGTETAAPGTLGLVRTVGSGPRAMLLIPGLGFGADIWTEFIESRKSEYTTYAVTLPGFGETPPLPIPTEGSRFVDQLWTRSSLRAIEALIGGDSLRTFTIVAHWALATQIALRLAIDHPDRVEAVVLIGGVLKSYYEGAPAMMTWTAEERARYAEGMGRRWFKTVTRRTWDDNNFMPYDYAVNPRRGLSLWREAQRPSLPVWIRYLLEFYSTDMTGDLSALKVPTLVVRPGFDDPDYYVEPGLNYMRNLCLDSWKGADTLNPALEFATIPLSRLFIMHDRPAELDSVVNAFLARNRK